MAVKVLAYTIVHFRTPDILDTHLSRLGDVAPDIRVSVLDADAPDTPHGDELRAVLAKYPRVDLHHIPNHSYAHAVNHALERAGLHEGIDGLVVVANADAYPGAETLAALAAAFQDPDVALAGPLGRTPSGQLQDLGLPYRWYTHQVSGQGAYAAYDVPWVSGFFFAVRLEAVRSAGGMDTTFRFYNEDLEWGFRFRRDGWRCRLVGAEAEHIGGAATGGSGRFLVEGLRGGMVFVQRYRGPLRVTAQRLGLLVWAEFQARISDGRNLATWRAVARMLRTGRYDVSPIGETLGDDADGFPENWPPTGA